MKHIQQYLSNTKGAPVLDKKRECADIFFKVSAVLVDSKYISFSGKIIFLKISPLEKSRLLLKKKEILACFSESKNVSFYTDIK